MGKTKKSKKWARRVLLVISITVTVISGRISKAALPKYRPLAEILSYAKWEELIRYDTNRVPGVSKLWSGRNANMSQAFWGGGTVRGFLHWHFIQLQTHTIGEVKRMPLPSSDELQLPGGKDVDIFAPISLHKSIKTILKGIKDLDILDVANVPEYIKLGGATLEKIGINPYAILDMSGGFRHYYEGRIVFKVSSEEEIKSSRFGDTDYTKTGESLRFIRFAYFNLPELESDPENRLLIRQIADMELPKITKEGQVAWIETSLDKLLVASGNDIPKVFTLLRDFNLFVVLSKVSVYVAQEDAESAKEWVRKNADFLTTDERQALEKNYGLVIGDGMKKCEEDLLNTIGVGLSKLGTSNTRKYSR
jgi:hypothetical protein